MSELEMTFEEMLNEESLRTLRNNSMAKGSVIRVTDNEVFVNLGYKADGIISKDEFSSEADVDLKSEVSVGDEIEVYIIKVNDGDGNVALSRKRLEKHKGYDELEDAFNNQTVLKGKVVDITKGGLITMINGMRVFVPSSQISNRFVQDLNAFKGEELDFKIIEFNRAKNRIVAGRKELAQEAENEKRAELFSTIEVGSQIEGIVNRIVDFGAFIDIGGVDGLVHISELSWGRVRNVNDVLKVGDKVNVYVLEADQVKNKISLSLKDSTQNPWVLAKEKYNVSDVVKGKIVRIVDFGAFVELEAGIDALVHISQISHNHISSAGELLEVGDEVEAKITEIDAENKKISLSIKALVSNTDSDASEE
ncbi:MAG: 30S ribosomal protein S1 [bacterium]